ncbi:MAG: formylglycine-generating enzyme family protein, partial [Cyanobacteria bacterium J06639_18]
VTVNRKGEITNRQPGSAKYFTEDLGNGVTLEMMEIPAGEFFMGSPADNESPQHRVNVKSFFMGKFVVTQAQYQEIMGKNPSRFKGEKRPVERVNWNDATEFCQKLTEKTGRTYRLPSEAEWEYACRAKTTTPFHFGETITTDFANYNGKYDGSKSEYRQQTTKVGIFPPNAFGLYDMHGNVWEWCQDTWHKNYDGAPTDGSAWIGNNNFYRLARGGSWANSRELASSAHRGGDVPWSAHDLVYSYIGFRVVCAFGRTL